MSETLAGYGELIERCQVHEWPPTELACLGSVRKRTVRQEGNLRRLILPLRNKPEDTLTGHAIFALRHETLNLRILYHVLRAVEPGSVAACVQKRPYGQAERRLWFLYEYLTHREVPISDLGSTRRIPLLPPDSYETGQSINSPRHGIANNLLGNVDFCPIVRSTERLKTYRTLDLRARAHALHAESTPDLMGRLVNYLYTQETKSTWGIEGEKPSLGRTRLFVETLRQAHQQDLVTPTGLGTAWASILGRNIRTGKPAEYRKFQNFVGAGQFRDIAVLFVPPKPDAIESLMTGLFQLHQRLKDSRIDPVVHAAIVSFGLVFIHPFPDGNGRVHRLLLHNILAMRDFTPPHFLFPLSASILSHKARYDATLDTFAQVANHYADLQMPEDTEYVKVCNDTSHLFRFMDLTEQVETLYHYIQRTVDEDLPQERDHLMAYDEACAAVADILDLSARDITLFVTFCRQQRGRLSQTTQKRFFAELSDRDIAEGERAVRRAFGFNSTET